MREAIIPAAMWLGLLALHNWPATALLGVVIWQYGQIRDLRGDSEAWYQLWMSAAERLRIANQRKSKARR